MKQGLKGGTLQVKATARHAAAPLAAPHDPVTCGVVMPGSVVMPSSPSTDLPQLLEQVVLCNDGYLAPVLTGPVACHVGRRGIKKKRIGETVACIISIIMHLMEMQ